MRIIKKKDFDSLKLFSIENYFFDIHDSVDWPGPYSSGDFKLNFIDNNLNQISLDVYIHFKGIFKWFPIKCIDYILYNFDFDIEIVDHPENEIYDVPHYSRNKFYELIKKNEESIINFISAKITTSEV